MTIIAACCESFISFYIQRKEAEGEIHGENGVKYVHTTWCCLEDL